MGRKNAKIKKKKRKAAEARVKNGTPNPKKNK